MSLGKTPVVVKWLYYSKRTTTVRRADLSELFSLIFVGKMCVFVSRPMKFVTFLKKNDYSPKRVVDFPEERDTFRNKIMEIVEDVDEKNYNTNGKPWKSSRILRVKPNFFFFSLFIIFLHFFVFLHGFFFFLNFLDFFHFSLFFTFFMFFISFISFNFSHYCNCFNYFKHSCFPILSFLSFLSFFHFSSFVLLFLLFLFLFLLLFWVARNPIFFGLDCFKISCSISFQKSFEPSRGTSLGTLFLFSLVYIFSFFFCYLLLFLFLFSLFLNFLFSCISFTFVLLRALVAECNCFLLHGDVVS